MFSIDIIRQQARVLPSVCAGGRQLAKSLLNFPLFRPDLGTLLEGCFVESPFKIRFLRIMRQEEGHRRGATKMGFVRSSRDITHKSAGFKFRDLSCRRRRWEGRQIVTELPNDSWTSRRLYACVCVCVRKKNVSHGEF